MKQIMNIRILIGGLVIPLLMSACTENKDEVEAPAISDVRIGVMAAVDAPMVTTRTAVSAVPYMETTPSTTNALDAAVWFSTTTCSYQDNGTQHELSRHTKVVFNTDGMVYPENERLMYPESGTVYAVGLYPYTGLNSSVWTSTDASGSTDYTKASHVINGVDDLMFAPQVSGTKASPIDAALTFNHQLTWIKINVIAASHDAIDAWGDVTSVTITNPNSKITITFSTGAASYTGDPEIITVYDGSKTLMITSQEVGSIFCAPATSYNISVNTDNLGVKNIVGVPLKGLDGTTPIENVADAIGNLFVITLYFKDTNVIDASCTLTQWDDVFEKLTGNVTTP